MEASRGAVSVQHDSNRFLLKMQDFVYFMVMFSCHNVFYTQNI